MKDMTLLKVASACKGTYFGPEEQKEREVAGVVIDSRQVEEGYLYIPIIGERVDGHAFISQVFEKGAAAVLSMKKLDTNQPYILVEDTKQALKDLAAFYLEATGVKVVGITGSVGKTSTKELIAAGLSTRFCVLKTEANFNNEIGLPLTVFRIRPEHEVAILEMGIDSFGEMHRLAAIAKPDIVVMTNIGTCHLENLHDRDGVLKAKSEIFDFLSKDGAVVLNGDDDKLQTIQDVHGIKPLFFGVDSRQRFFADHIKNMGFAGTNANLYVGDKCINVTIPLPGIHMVYNALAALAVGTVLGMTMEEIKAGIESVQSIKGRVHLIHTESLTIMDDCYNANPMSMKSSIDILKSQECKRRVCILGDMFELGEAEEKLHYEVGEHAAKADLDVYICVGTLSRNTQKALAEAGKNVFYFETLERAMNTIPGLLKKGDTIIVKASHGMQFTKVVDMLENLTLEENTDEV